MFKEGKLKADSPSFQLRDSFDKIPLNLINDEFKTHQRLARSFTAQVLAEAKMKAFPEEKEWAVMAKLNGATLGEHLAAFVSAKRRCCSAVIGKAGLKHETRLLA